MILIEVRILKGNADSDTVVKQQPTSGGARLISSSSSQEPSRNALTSAPSTNANAKPPSAARTTRSLAATSSANASHSSLHTPQDSSQSGNFRVHSPIFMSSSNTHYKVISRGAKSAEKSSSSKRVWMQQLLTHTMLFHDGERLLLIKTRHQT